MAEDPPATRIFTFAFVSFRGKLLLERYRRVSEGHMPKKKVLTITEVARMGGLAALKKHGRKKFREWGKLGGRPRKQGKKAKK